MKILFPKSLCVALGIACLPALAVAQSYLPLPQTSAPVYRPVHRTASSYYAQDAATGSSLINHVAQPPVADVDEVPSPSDEAAMPSPAAEYGKSAVKGGKGCASCGKGLGHGKGYAAHGCGPNGCLRGLLGGRGCWYGGAGALWLDRDNADEVYLTVLDTAIDVGILSTHDVNMDRTAGLDLTVGRYLHGGCSAMEFSYWGIDPNREQASVFDADAAGVGSDLISAFDMTSLNYDDGAGGVGSIDGWFNNARVHRVTQNWDIENLELNFVHHSCTGCYAGLCGCQRRYSVSMVCGVRYMNFDESFSFQADDTDAVFDGGIGEVRYDIDVDNHLLGFQLGCRGDYHYNDCLVFHSTAKVGVYGNRIDHSSFIGGVNGAATVGAGPNAGREFDINSDKTDFAMISELDLAASYRLSCRWRAKAGYRLVALSGVALTADQIPAEFADIDGVANIGSESSVILHGGYAWLEFNY